MGGEETLFRSDADSDDGRGKSAVDNTDQYKEDKGSDDKTYLPAGGLWSGFLTLSAFFTAAAASRKDLFCLLLVALPARCLSKLVL